MWIKICGIRDCETACQVAALGADAIGLNFYPRSSRFVEMNIAEQISQTLPGTVLRVGVFVNHPMNEIESATKRCALDIVQLHGDEPAADLIELHRRLPGVRFVRAWRMGNDGLSGLKAYLDSCRQAAVPLAGCLVDAHVPDMYGGSGKQVPWQQLSEQYSRDEWPPLILAGGLTPANIALAIRSTQPWGVDVASGVESSAGVKDLRLTAEFIANARAA